MRDIFLIHMLKILKQYWIKASEIIELNKNVFLPKLTFYTNISIISGIFCAYFLFLNQFQSFAACQIEAINKSNICTSLFHPVVPLYPLV